MCDCSQECKGVVCEKCIYLDLFIVASLGGEACALLGGPEGTRFCVQGRGLLTLGFRRGVQGVWYRWVWGLVRL